MINLKKIWFSGSPTHRVGESLTLRLSNSPSFFLNIQKLTPWLAELESRQLPDSSRRVAESGSRFSITNISANMKPKSKRLER
jgi:hypothetical protein